jgi:hypothetical protein
VGGEPPWDRPLSQHNTGVGTLKPTSQAWATCTSARVGSLSPAAQAQQRQGAFPSWLVAPHSPPVAERPPVRPTGPSGSWQRGAFRQRLETRSPAAAAFRLRGRASRRSRGAGGYECVLVRVCEECACVSVCARAGRGCAGSQIPLGAHPGLCLLRLPLTLLPAQGPGFRISCLFNERKGAKADGEGAEGGSREAGRPSGPRMLREGHECSLRSSGRAKRAKCNARRERLSPSEQPGFLRVPERQQGNPNANVRLAWGLRGSRGSGNQWRDFHPT